MPLEAARFRSDSTSRLTPAPLMDAWISARAWSSSTGFERYSTAPSFIARTAVSSVPWAVMTTYFERGATRRTSSSAVSPSMPGSFTSMKIELGLLGAGRSRCPSRPWGGEERVAEALDELAEDPDDGFSSSTTSTLAMGQLDPERGSAGARIVPDAAAVVLDDALGQRQPEADAVLLRRHERLEDLRSDLGRNAGPRVRHREADAPVARGPRPRAAGPPTASPARR
jgi:hypothetical protein